MNHILKKNIFLLTTTTTDVEDVESHPEWLKHIKDLSRRLKLLIKSAKYQ